MTSTLKARVLRAGSWSMLGYATSQVLRLAGNLIMTRLLVPEMFGVMAIVTMFSVVMHLLTDIGLNQNIVRNARGDDPDFLDTIWVVQIVRGLGIWIISLLISAGLYVAGRQGLLPADSVYATPILPMVLAVSTFSAVIAGFQSTRIGTAHRRFEQKLINQQLLLAQIAALLVMVAIGSAVRSIWALVAGGLTSALVTTVLSHFWLPGHANSFRWQKEAVRDLFHFGKWIAVSSAVGTLAANGDRIVLGGVMDAHALGLYAIAAFIVGSIEGGLTNLFMSVSLPALGETARSNKERLRDVYYQMRIPADLILLSALGFLFVAGQTVISILYDPRYRLAGPFLQILAWSLFSVRFGISQQVYLALGVPKYLTVTNVARFVALYAAVPIAYHFWGTTGAVWAIALHAAATIPLMLVFNIKFGVNDFRREALVLVGIPVGMLAGYAFNALPLPLRS